METYLKARLPIDGRLAAREGADRYGGPDGWRGTGKFLVFTYRSSQCIICWFSKAPL